jgi:hypothetical protein
MGSSPFSPTTWPGKDTAPDLLPPYEAHLIAADEDVCSDLGTRGGTDVPMRHRLDGRSLLDDTGHRDG